jgi:hypothetical protein
MAFRSDDQNSDASESESEVHLLRGIRSETSTKRADRQSPAWRTQAAGTPAPSQTLQYHVFTPSASSSRATARASCALPRLAASQHLSAFSCEDSWRPAPAARAYGVSGARVRGQRERVRQEERACGDDAQRTRWGRQGSRRWRGAEAGHDEGEAGWSVQVAAVVVVVVEQAANSLALGRLSPLFLPFRAGRRPVYCVMHPEPPSVCLSWGVASKQIQYSGTFELGRAREPARGDPLVAM